MVDPSALPVFGVLASCAWDMKTPTVLVSLTIVPLWLTPDTLSLPVVLFADKVEMLAVVGVDPQ